MFKEYKFIWILPCLFLKPNRRTLSSSSPCCMNWSNSIVTLSRFCKSSWVSRWFDKPTLGMKPQTIWDRVTRLPSEKKPALFLGKASHCTTPSWQKIVAAPFALIKVPTETYAFLFLAEIRIEPSPFWTSEVLRFFSISYTFCTWVKNIKILSTEKFEINKFISSCIVFLKQCLLCEWISLPQLLQPRWGI